MNRRRRLVLSIAAYGTLASAPAFAQPARRVHRVGLLSVGGTTVYIDAFLKTLAELGYVEGKSLVLERRFADGQTERLPGFAAELVNIPVDVIVTFGSPATIAAARVTKTIPIVFAGNSDPIGTGLVASLGKPGRNVTGSSLMATELSAKRLELLRLLLPNASRIAILWDSSNPGMALRVKETRVAADKFHVLLHPVGPRNAEELNGAFAELAKLNPDALLVTVEPFTREHLPRILDFCAANRIPAMYEESGYVDRGGLMSYGPNLIDIYRRAAPYVDKILKGARPADLPVEQPTKFDLVINMKTARAMRLNIPDALLLRADKVVE